MPAGDAVSFFIEGRPVDADSHPPLHHGEEAAADAALCGDADADGKFAGTVVHAAGEHDGFYDADGVRVQKPVFGWIPSFARTRPSPARLSAVTLKEHMRM